jgi:hypothetical protein
MDKVLGSDSVTIDFICTVFHQTVYPGPNRHAYKNIPIFFISVELFILVINLVVYIQPGELTLISLQK